MNEQLSALEKCRLKDEEKSNALILENVLQKSRLDQKSEASAMEEKILCDALENSLRDEMAVNVANEDLYQKALSDSLVEEDQIKKIEESLLAVATAMSLGKHDAADDAQDKLIHEVSKISLEIEQGIKHLEDEMLEKTLKTSSQEEQQINAVENEMLRHGLESYCIEEQFTHVIKEELNFQDALKKGISVQGIAERRSETEDLGVSVDAKFESGQSQPKRRSSKISAIFGKFYRTRAFGAKHSK